MDIVSIILTFIQISIYLYVLCIRYYHERLILKKKDWFQDTDKTSFYAVTYGITRIVFLFRLYSSSSFDIPNMSNSDIEDYLRGTIIIDSFLFLLAGSSVNTVVLSMIKISSGSFLFQPFEVFGKELNPVRSLNVMRFMIFLINIAFTTCFVHFGVYGPSMQSFVYWRRVVNLYYAFLILIYSPGLLYFFSSKVLKMLKGSLKIKENPVFQYEEPMPTSSEYKNEVKATPKAPSAESEKITAISFSKSLSFLGNATLKSLVLSPRVEEKNRAISETKKRIVALDLVIKAIFFILYIPNGIYHLAYCFINEIFARDHQALLAFKVVVDLGIWLTTIFYSFYQIFNLKLSKKSSHRKSKQ